MAGPRTATESLRWSARLDNYNTPRDYAMGTGLVYAADEDGTRAETITLLGVDELRENNKAVYLLDDGKTVTVWYVAGWSSDPADRSLYLQQFPTNPDGRTRPDNGRVIDYNTWQLGPRRSYHLKITRLPVCAEGAHVNDDNPGQPLCRTCQDWAS